MGAMSQTEAGWGAGPSARYEALAERFPDQNQKGAVAYGLMRSLQMRRLRLPKPQVKRGERP